MHHVRRFGAAFVGVAALVLVAAQVTSAAPAAKLGTTYVTTMGAENLGNLQIVGSMTMPTGKYHITATVNIQNISADGQTPGDAIPQLSCFLFAAGVNTEADTTVAAGGFDTMTMELAVDASRDASVFTDVECKIQGTFTHTVPFVFARVTADVVAGVVQVAQP